MNDEQVSNLVDRIILGKYVFIVDNVKYCLVNPNIATKIKSNFIYDKIYSDNLYDTSFVDPDRLDFMLKLYDIIPKDYEKKIKQLEKDIENIKVGLFKNYKRKISRESYKISLKKEQDNLDNLYNKKSSWDFLLLTNFVNRYKVEFLFANSIYGYESETLVFDYDNLDVKSLHYFIDILQKDPLKKITTYKHIAVNNLWRNYWACDKTNVFNGSVVDWTDEQRTLVSICKMFDSIYENPECPDEEILEDFDALDGWIISQRRKSIAEKKQKGVKEMLGKNTKDGGEVFLIADNQDDAENILDMNSEEAMFNYKTRIDMLNKSNGKTIKDTDFPDIKSEINKRLKSL